MKKVLITTFILSIICGMIYSLKFNAKSDIVHLKLDYQAENIEELINDTAIIIDGNISEEQEEFEEEGITFILTKIKVKEVLVGSKIEKGDTITLLQTKSYEDPTVAKGSNKILFLEKYEGYLVDDAYICKGLYQGQYNIEKDSIKASSSDVIDKVTNEVEQMTLTELREKVKKNKKNDDFEQGK